MSDNTNNRPLGTEADEAALRVLMAAKAATDKVQAGDTER